MRGSSWVRLGEVERGRRRKKGRGFMLILDRELRGLEMVVGGGVARQFAAPRGFP